MREGSISWAIAYNIYVWSVRENYRILWEYQYMCTSPLTWIVDSTINLISGIIIMWEVEVRNYGTLRVFCNNLKVHGLDLLLHLLLVFGKATYGTSFEIYIMQERVYTLGIKQRNCSKISRWWRQCYRINFPLSAGSL